VDRRESRATLISDFVKKDFGMRLGSFLAVLLALMPLPLTAAEQLPPAAAVVPITDT
jgi:hypothetical protein